jgi:hypothetical protein
VVAWSGDFLEILKFEANLDHSCLGTHVCRLAIIWKFGAREICSVMVIILLKPEVSNL